MEEDWVVLCQALYLSIGEEVQSSMHESLTEVCTKREVKKAVHRIAGLAGWRMSDREPFSSPREDL